MRAPWLDSEAAREHARPFLEWLTARHAAHGGLTEVRILAREGVYQAIVDPTDVDGLLADLAPTEGRSEHPRVGQAHVYFGMNAVGGDWTRRRLTRTVRCVRDREVHANGMFVVDIDPVRPAGESATDAERASAHDVADRVAAWLRTEGAPPIVADSGNGVHLLVPLVPTFGEMVAETAQHARTLLRQLDQQFSTEAAKVDTSTWNPSRILKLYGTPALKGPGSAERPHRLARVDLEVLPEDVDLFAGLAAEEGPRDWPTWRRSALAALPLEAVYGAWLTGRRSGEGWLECRDPLVVDANPSAGVAEGTGQAERATFHSFRDGRSLSVFDFLVQSGRAATVGEACRVVAGLTGVPLPAGRDTTDVVRVKLRAAAELGALEQHRALEQLREESGVPLKVLVRSLGEEKRRRKRSRPEASDRVVVDFVQNADRLEDLFERLVQAVLPAERLFAWGEGVTFVQPGVGPVAVDERNLSGLLSSLVELRVMQDTDDGQRMLRYDLVPRDLARAMVHSPSVRERLPELQRYTRSPVFAQDWRFLGTPGHDAESGVWYDGPEVSPAAGTATLDRLLATFAWKEEVDRVNFVGALLTAITMPHWGSGHPFLAINGNKPGVGKSTLARFLGVVAEGRPPSTVSWTRDEAEFEKQLATRVELGDRVLIVDNAKASGELSSAVLERCITDTRLSFRRLGSNTAITRPENDLLFVLTMNLTALGADLRRRALPVNLELEGDVRTARFDLDDPLAEVLRCRHTLVAELAGLVVRWVEAGRPAGPAAHSTSRAWAATIDGILRVGGMEGFLSNFTASEHAFDPRYGLMVDIARRWVGEPPGTAACWASRLAPELSDRFAARRGIERSERAKSTIVGRLFGDYLGADLDGIEVVREYPDGSTHSPVYGFQRR